MILQFAILTLLCFVAEVFGTCDICQSNFASCHDERRFSLCLDGISQEDILTCPIGYVCTDEPEICLKRSATNSIQPSCGAMCGLCESPDNLFTCLSETVYAYCFGDLQPDYNAEGACPLGYLCNFNSRKICTPVSDGTSCYSTSSTTDVTTEGFSTTTGSSSISTSDGTTESPSKSTSDGTIQYSSSTTESLITSTTTSDGTTESSGTTDSSTISTNPTNPTVASTDAQTSTANSPVNPTSSSVVPTFVTSPTTTETELITTTSRPKDEHDFCRENQVAGFFKDKNDPTCKHFILCYVISGEYLAMKFSCNDDEYYDEEAEACEFKRPASCQVL